MYTEENKVGSNLLKWVSEDSEKKCGSTFIHIFVITSVFLSILILIGVKV